MSILGLAVRSKLALRDGARAVVRRVSDDRGASAVEYALLVALIAVVIIVAVRALGSALSGQLSEAATAISGA